jgi:hypothetical protein
VQRVRKKKVLSGSRATAGKRNGRSAEQTLLELKRRLREISDLNAASDVLNWDQATFAGLPAKRVHYRAIVCAVTTRAQDSQSSMKSSPTARMPSIQLTVLATTLCASPV